MVMAEDDGCVLSAQSQNKVCKKICIGTGQMAAKQSFFTSEYNSAVNDLQMMNTVVQ